MLLIRLSELPETQEAAINGGSASGNKSERAIFSVRWGAFVFWSRQGLCESALRKSVDGRAGVIPRPSRSPDLTSVDFLVCSFKKEMTRPITDASGTGASNYTEYKCKHSETTQRAVHTCLN